MHWGTVGFAREGKVHMNMLFNHFAMGDRGVHKRGTESNSHCLHLAIPCMSAGVSGQVTPGSSLHLEVVAESRNRGLGEGGRSSSCAAASR